MCSGLRLHAVNECVGTKLKIHNLAHGYAEGRYEIRVRIGARRNSNEMGDDLTGIRNADRAADKVNGFDCSVSDLTRDRACDALQARAQNGGIVCIAVALSALRIFDRNLQSAGEDKVKMVAASGLVVQRNQ